MHAQQMNSDLRTTIQTSRLSSQQNAIVNTFRMKILYSQQKIRFFFKVLLLDCQCNNRAGRGEKGGEEKDKEEAEQEVIPCKYTAKVCQEPLRRIEADNSYTLPGLKTQLKHTQD